MSAREFNRTAEERDFAESWCHFAKPTCARDLDAFACWYRDARPHQGLGGATPAEIRDGRRPVCEQPGVEQAE